MKKMLALIVVLMVSAPAFGQDLDKKLKKIEQEIKRIEAHKDNTKVIVKDDVVEVHADDLDYAKDTLFEYKLIKHPKNKFKVYVAPLPKPSLKLLKENASDDIRVSLGKTLVEGYKISYEAIVEMMEKEKPEVVKKMRENPRKIRDNLAHVEQFLGLNKINSEELSLAERCYRVCWVEGIYRYKHAENVQLIFVINE